jgi:MFS family permease
VGPGDRVTSDVARTANTGLAARQLRRVVAVLCATEIVSWGILFYAFPVLSTTIRDTEGWSLTWLVACFTAAQLVAAAVGLWVGRRIDTHGPRGVMTAGSCVGVLAVLVIAGAPNLVGFLLGWLVAGVAMSGTLYAPAFAAVTGWAGDQRVKALTAVTLVAGLASTVFAPVTALLVDHLSWRATYVCLAVLLVSTIPLHWFGLRAPWTPLAGHQDGSGLHDPARRRVVHQPEFMLLVAAMTLGGFCVYAVVVNLVPLLSQHGLSTTAAAVALGVGGAGQVAGRLFYGPVLTRYSARIRTVGTLAAASLTTLALAVVHHPVVLVCLLSFAAGTARGIFTLIQATAVSDRWGTQDFGARNGILSGGVMAAAAFAPWVGTLLASALGGYAAAFVVLAIGSLGATALVRPHHQESDPIPGVA